MTELELLREEVDRLTARSWAHEAFLLYLLVQRGMQPTVFLQHETADIAQRLHDSLRHSPLTDRQLTLFQEEVRAVLSRLPTVGGLDRPISL